MKTHKTASTTAATILYRYGKRHNLNVANFDGHQSSIELRDAVKQVKNLQPRQGNVAVRGHFLTMIIFQLFGTC